MSVEVGQLYRDKDPREFERVGQVMRIEGERAFVMWRNRVTLVKLSRLESSRFERVR